LEKRWGRGEKGEGRLGVCQEKSRLKPTSRRLNVVVQSPPLYPRDGLKWRENYLEGPDHPVNPQSSGWMVGWLVNWVLDGWMVGWFGE